MKQYTTSSELETKHLAEKIARENKGHIFALTGELGAGKTIFAQGFAKGLNILEKVISPTYVLIRQHKVPNSQKTFYHIDLYRLDQIENIKDLGLEEIWSNPNNIVLIEWAEKIKNFLPENIVKIIIEKTENNKRLITVE